MSDARAEVRLRGAVDSDDRQILEWRNEPGARAASFSTAAISLEEHRAWLSRRPGDSVLRLYVVSTADGRDIGYVRFDIHGESAEISVCLDPACRLRGFGRAAIREGARLMLRDPKVKRIVALVKPDNPASLAAFRAAGFVDHGREMRGDVNASVLELRQVGHENA